jgi:hypothetical protein
MSASVPNILRLAIALISGFAFLNGFSLSTKEWSTTGACPSISGVPACYVVTIAYLLIFTSTLITNRPLYKRLFAIGSSIVFGLAMAGAIMQITGLGECPKTASGFPMCYISLGICSLLIMIFIARVRLPIK